MKLPSYFKDLLANIEPSQSYKNDQASGHATLRRRLAADPDFGPIHVNTFLQGSYRRNTAIHPGKDVDIVVVTTLNPDRTTPADANSRLKKCLDKYHEKVAAQTRSFCVTLSYVTMDVVLATSRQLVAEDAFFSWLRKAEDLEKADAWAGHSLLIPDSDLGRWVETDPKRQIAWTTELNAKCGGYFVPLVKMLKWWRQEAYSQPKYPKGYVLERIAGECVDVTVRDNAEGFVRLLEAIVQKFAGYAAAGLVPNLPDAGVATHNVAHRLSAADFSAFIKKVADAAKVARAALDEDSTSKSAELWRKLFGQKFPAAPATTDASFPPAPVRPNKPAGFA